MIVFIVGGGGVLGRHLGYHFAKNGHEVHIFDIDTIDIDRNIIPNEQIHIMPRGSSFNVLNDMTRSNHPHVIYHLAETASIDMHDHIYAIHDNLGLTSDVLYICARYNIRGIIGTWEPINNLNSSILVHSLNQKSELIKYFHKGNVVVNEARIPQLIHPGYPGIKFGAFLSRLAYHIEFNQPFYVGDECEIYTDVRAYNTLEPVINELILMATVNTRRTITIEGYRYPLQSLIEFALHAFDVDSVTLVSKGEPREYTRTKCTDRNPIYKWVRDQDW